jgi:hypothetical protein
VIDSKAKIAKSFHVKWSARVTTRPVRIERGPIPQVGDDPAIFGMNLKMVAVKSNDPQLSPGKRVKSHLKRCLSVK